MLTERWVACPGLRRSPANKQWALQAPSASERALALAAAPQRPTSPTANVAQRSVPQRLHNRRVSWEDVTNSSPEQQPRGRQSFLETAASESPTASNPGWLCSPFASPFAEASMTPLDVVDRDDSGELLP